MNHLAVVVLLAATASASAGLVVAPSTKIIQGPSSKSTIVGPDGSSITSFAPGGTIVAENTPAVVAHTAPVVAAAPAVVAARAAPLVAAYPAPVGYSSPFAYAAPAAYSTYAHAVPVAYAAPTYTAYATPVVAKTAVDTVVAGPSGTIATSKYAATPAVVAAHSLYV